MSCRPKVHIETLKYILIVKEAKEQIYKVHYTSDEPFVSGKVYKFKADGISFNFPKWVQDDPPKVFLTNCLSIEDFDGKTVGVSEADKTPGKFRILSSGYASRPGEESHFFLKVGFNPTKE